MKLDDFDESRIQEFVGRWNAHKCHARARGTIEKVPYPLADSTRELAGQPLLLLLVALLYAESMGELGEAVTETRGSMYRHIVRTFVRREIQKSAPQLALEELETSVDHEVLLLEYAALG
ncbi:hypothetical protein JS562_53885, partial [Agrobacterium sp. S2]|nr:hypothetical protein [Agrobacterium sp. S2]